MKEKKVNNHGLVAFRERSIPSIKDGVECYLCGKELKGQPTIKALGEYEVHKACME